ncbi:hypothetical protein [Solicola sp. PLA-1-18]|uniref:hypothetical protein n=1 Tax=Solicola sp. PLA-1-18 TaxID=3380532 RepID=UPI003B786BE7
MHVRPALTIVAGAAVISALVAAPVHAADVPTCFGRTATIVGGPPDPNVPDVSGTDGDDVIVTGNAGFATTGPGDDRICVTGTASFVAGGTGDDRIRVDGGSDYVSGDEGDDVIHVANGNATYGYAGRDVIVDAGGGDVFGGEGFDVVAGTRDSSITIVDDAGPDLYYGAGNPENILSYTGSAGPVRIDLRRGRVRGPSGTDHLVRVRSVGGTSAPDVMIGDRHANRFFGVVFVGRLQSDPQMVGADVIRAGGGDDRIDAVGFGTRVLGQGGDDRIRTDAFADGGGGTDQCDATTVVRCEGPVPIG